MAKKGERVSLLDADALAEGGAATSGADEPRTPSKPKKAKTKKSNRLPMADRDSSAGSPGGASDAGMSSNRSSESWVGAHGPDATVVHVGGGPKFGGATYGSMAGMGDLYGDAHGPGSPIQKTISGGSFSRGGGGSGGPPKATGGTSVQRFARAVCCCRLTRGTAAFRFTLLFMSALVVLSGCVEEQSKRTLSEQYVV